MFSYTQLWFKYWLVILFLYSTVANLYSQRPELSYQPYWIRAMDENRPDYFRAIQSFEEYWQGKIIPIERFDYQINISKKKNKKRKYKPESLPPGEDMELLKLYSRRFKKWVRTHQAFIGKDGKIKTAKIDKSGTDIKNKWRNSGVKANWKATGPSSAQMDPIPSHSRVGRMVQLKFHPVKPDILYAIGGSAGLFKSVDNGKTWHVLGTDALPFGYQPSSVCIDYTDDQVLYLGMGDPNFGSQGHGVWKSVNGGESWYNTSGQMGDIVVYEVLQSPRQSNCLIVAADQGIWYSPDGGQNWQQKVSLVHDAFLDMVYKPGSPDTIYACTFSKFFRSTDDGISWHQITDGIEVPSGGGRGMRLAISKSNPEVVYLGMFANHGTVFKSENGGNSFEMIYRDTVNQSLTTYTGNVNGDSNGQYNFSMVADPLNSDIVYFGTQTLWKSEDGGITWNSLYPYLAKVHPDIHDLEFSPNDHSLFNINDGGIAVSKDGGQVWEQRNDGIIAAEIYNGGQSPIRRDMMIIGTQDNGSLGLRNSKWLTIAHGDVYDDFWFDYHTSDRYYNDKGNSKGMESNKTYQSNFPIETSGYLKMAFSPAEPKVAFVCQNEVWRCDDIYDPLPQWKKISEPLSGTTQDYIRDIQVSPYNANELFFILSNAKILHSQNALADHPIYDTIQAPDGTSYFQSMAVSWNESSILYYTSWNKIYRSSDKGISWTDITDNLPDDNIIKLIHDRFEDNESIYVLCGNRVYYRNDSLGSWVDYSHDLPGLAYVSDLLVYNDGSNNSLIRAITYGRGVFETAMHKTKPIPYCDFSSDMNTICPGDGILFSDSSIDANTWEWEFPGGEPQSFTGKNPPVIRYEMSGVYPVSLTVRNPNGEDKEEKLAFILVKPSFTAPHEQDFEGAFPPEGYEIQALHTDNVKWNLAGLGAYEESDHCAVFIDNIPFSSSEMKFAVDLSALQNPRMSFDIAYGKRIGNTEHDSLEIRISADCGKTFFTVYKLGGDLLSTMPDIESVLSFNPGKDGWRREQIDLSSFGGHPFIEISIIASGGANEVITLDNIQISESSNSSIAREPDDPEFEIYPNPARDVVFIHWDNLSQSEICVSDSHGKIIQHHRYPSGDERSKIELTGLNPGTYLVTFITENGSRTKVLVVH